MAHNQHNAMSRLLAKICGITRTSDAQAALEAGADCFGMVYLFSRSPRCVSPDQARLICESVALPAVLVTVNLTVPDLVSAANELLPHALQLHGEEPPELVRRLKESAGCQVWKVIHIPPGKLSSDEWKRVQDATSGFVEAGCDALLIDTHLAEATDEKRYGGTGLAGDWEALAEMVRAIASPVILSGGLRPDNVEQAIRTVRPAGVDASSGLERAPGLKDPERIRSFVSAVRRADSGHIDR